MPYRSKQSRWITFGVPALLLMGAGSAFGQSLTHSAAESLGQFEGNTRADGNASLLAPSLRATTPDGGVWARVQDDGQDRDEMPESLARLYRSRGRRSADELSEIRDRRVGMLERESASVLNELQPLVSEAREATFEVIVDEQWAAMGCVISPDGYALTKASTLDDRETVRCRFGQSQWVDAKVVKQDSDNDVALLKLDSGDYSYLQLSRQEPSVGTICLSVGVRDPLIAMGTCSVASRSLMENRLPILGVVPRPAAGGILVSQVEEGARRAGIQDGDIITKLAGEPVTEVTQFVNLIRRYKAGQEVVVTTLRDDQEMVFTVRLGRRNLGRMAPRFEAMNLLGSINSKRRTNFPWVMQHDSPLMPEECGGPLLDLEGRVIGLNIARGGRIMSYAITGEHLQQMLAQFDIPEITHSATTPR